MWDPWYLMTLDKLGKVECKFCNNLSFHIIRILKCFYIWAINSMVVKSLELQCVQCYGHKLRNYLPSVKKKSLTLNDMIVLALDMALKSVAIECRALLWRENLLQLIKWKRSNLHPTYKKRKGS
jgi:hypothetical protein